MASLEARYLASLITDSVSEESDLGIVSQTVLLLLRATPDVDSDVLATVLQQRLGEQNIPAWE